MNAQTALQRLRAEAHVSVSSLTAYLTCPNKYLHRYILQTPPAHRPGALALGSALHEALAYFYRGLMETRQEPSLEELEAAFHDAWHHQLDGSTPILFGGKETADTALDTGINLVRTFHEHAPRNHKVVGVEEPFAVEIQAPTGKVLAEKLVGVFDAVVETTDGNFTILEHKSAKRRYTGARLANDIQVTAYALAAPLVGLGQANVVLQVLLKTKQPALELYNPVRTDQDRQDLLYIITGVMTAIRAGSFYPKRDWWCQGCPYQAQCLAG
jgi:CRISPR/Cas system-associated exonuclease Cas4 (RecB family)